MKRTFALAACVLAFAACREDRAERPLPGDLAPVEAVRQSELQPGMPSRGVVVRNPYGENPNAVAEGRRLYGWYNCSGCHFAGGGGIGPPLMDEEWIYGHEPQNILDSILEGRPDGMPAYRGRLPLDHAWKIVAYVESLGGVPEERQPADVGRPNPNEDDAAGSADESPAGEGGTEGR